MSRTTNGEAPIGVNDDLPDSTVFKVKTAPRWSEHILEVLSTSISWQRENNPLSIAQLEESQHYVLLSGRLYRLGPDKVLRLCLDPDCYDDAMNEAHVSIGGLHASTIQTKQRILLNGFWWPTLENDVHKFVHECPRCQTLEPIPYATLYSIMQTPTWSLHIVDYLQNGHTDSSKPTHRQRLIEIEAMSYTLIKDQLYHRGKDGNLRLCVPESQYLEILYHTHAGISGGHFSGPITAKLILWSGLWWPTLHMDALEFVKRCEQCQRTKPLVAREEMPLRPIMATRAFAK